MAATSKQDIYDLFVIGGGVNGCGVARDAAGRGLSVLLVEKDDLAQATSSASTKLFHGGLRYLEYFQFGMVRDSLIERETLLKMMPHISWPLRFVFPVTPDLRIEKDSSSLGRLLAWMPGLAGRRPAWLTRIGLFIYDHLGGRRILPACQSIDLCNHAVGAPLDPRFKRGFEYSDCWVEDSRLVVLNARSAVAHGAKIQTRTRFVSAKREGETWRVTLAGKDGTEQDIVARAIVNAAGPWAKAVLSGEMSRNNQHGLRLVRGSHIITRRLFDHDQPYFLQLTDGRIIFAIPYEQNFTLIGTTDVDHPGDPASASCSQEEQTYLLEAANRFLRVPVTEADVVASFAGVRPLYDDGAAAAAAATRDYVLTCDDSEGRVETTPSGTAPLVNVFGGKITTYRKLAENVMGRLAPYFPAMSGSWSSGQALPGGDFNLEDKEVLLGKLEALHPFLDAGWATRLMRAYGTDSFAMLEGMNIIEDLGHHFGGNLYEREVLWLMTHEWAVTADDVLWRRSKLGLVMTDAEAAALDRWMASKASMAA